MDTSQVKTEVFMFNLNIFGKDKPSSDYTVEVVRRCSIALKDSAASVIYRARNQGMKRVLTEAEMKSMFVGATYDLCQLEQFLISGATHT